MIHAENNSSTKNIDYSIIAPLFNEEESIGPLYEAIKKGIENVDLQYEIIFVDDGSSDKTFEKARILAKEDKTLRVIKFRKNYGQTPAMAAGIDHARGKILVTMDGDLQNDPRDIPQFIQKINEGFDIVVGWRFKRQDKLITRKIPSIIANWLIGKVTGVPIKDNGCSLKAYRSGVIKNVPLYSEMHRFIPAMTSIAGARVAEIKVRHHARKFGESKYGLSRIFKVLCDLISIKMIISFSSRPIIGFGIGSVISMIFGLFSFILAMLYSISFPGQSLVIFLGCSILLFSLGVFLTVSGLLCDLIYKTGNIKLEKLSSLTAVNGVYKKSEVKIKALQYEQQD
jgi:glycosyltransferase involved in cell wall biosynthesis